MRAHGGEEDERRPGQHGDREPKAAERLEDPPSVGDELRADDGERDDRELDPGRHGERREYSEGELPPGRRFGDQRDAGVNGGEDERVRERVGEHARRVDAVRDRDRERRDGDRDPLRQRQSPAE